MESKLQPNTARKGQICAVAATFAKQIVIASMCSVRNGVAPVQKRFWVVQKTLGWSFAHSPNHFSRFIPLQELPMSAASQFWIFCLLYLFLRFARFGRARNILGSVSGRTDFSRMFFFGPPDFFEDFVAGCFLSFLGQKVPRKILQENPWQNPPKLLQQKPPTHFCRGVGPKHHIFRLEFQDTRVRVVETVFLEDSVLVPCRKQVLLTKIGENSVFAFNPQKLPSYCRIAVCQTYRSDNPDGDMCLVASYCEIFQHYPSLRLLMEVRPPPLWCATPFGTQFRTGTSVRCPNLLPITQKFCAVPIKLAPKIFAILSLQVLRDTKSIAAAPLRRYATARRAMSSLRAFCVWHLRWWQYSTSRFKIHDIEYNGLRDVMLWFVRGGKSTRKNPPKIKKSSSEQVFLNNFRSVPDSCHREEGKSSRELFEKVRVNAVFFWYFGILGGFVGL